MRMMEKAMKKRGTAAGTASTAKGSTAGIQGEGNYQAAREFNDAEIKFVASGKVPAAILAASPKSATELREMLAAEQAGKRQAKK